MAEESLLDAMRSLLPADDVLTGGLERYAVDGVTPQLAVLARDDHGVASVLAEATRLDAAVIPWGGGTSMALGNVPRRYDIALDVTRLNAIVDHAPEDLTVVVQAGMRLGDLQDHLAKSGQYLPFDPPQPETATIGGILASNAGGPSRHAYGWPRDWTLGLRVALADGSVTKTGGRVVKNVAGYDMTKLYLGSFGTLGVIVEAAFKVTVLPESRATLAAFFRGHGAACKAALALYQRNLAIEALEVAGPGPVDLFEGTGVRQKGWAVLAAAAGVPAAVERSLREATQLASDNGAASTERLEGEGEECLWRNVRAFIAPPANGDGLLTRAALLPSQTDAFLDEVEALAARHRVKGQSVAHAGVGGVYILWQAGKRSLSERGARLLAELRSAAWEWDAPLVIERCPVALKGEVDVWGEPRGDFPLMRNVKGQLDPKGVLSPGRFLGRM
ncbi:MAG: FAD-binding oxidoreductase [Dehalococcoidia bacterium]|nr:FAD-binding oxidoreductase [Dehalococcoidia bacterium]